MTTLTRSRRLRRISAAWKSVWSKVSSIVIVTLTQETLRTAVGPVNVARPLIVGVVNATPDSFSDRGDRSTAGSIAQVARHLEDGAAVIEIGGESNVTNRPAVTAEEEIRRIMPVVEAAVEAEAVVSVDTYKPAVAAAALEAGAAIVNDISGGGNRALMEVAAGAGAGVVLMHTVVEPKSQRWDEAAYPDGITAHQLEFFRQRLGELDELGIGADQVVIDPGPDFGKTPRQTVDSLRGLPELGGLGCPMMLAVSRKDFVGAITHRPPSQRGAGTFAALAFGMSAGGRLLRVHDVAGTRDFLAVWEALHGEAEVDPGLRIAEEIRREPPRDEPVV
ncbi:MAG: dihydropteroate synthase [Solirubrobacterales bacterium]|nr:dihydropteroate synthase [Solirubrobacterales bacterium]